MDCSYSRKKPYPQGNAEARFKMNGVKIIYLYCNQRNVKPCAYEMSAAFLFYKKMPLPENELFEKNGNRIMTEAADCARICMKCITKI